MRTLAFLLLAGGAVAAPASSMESPAGASPAAASATESVKVMRASDDHGTDVRSSDHRNVGDIVDFVFDVRGTPQLAYVLVITGGFSTSAASREPCRRAPSPLTAIPPASISRRTNT